MAAFQYQALDSEGKRVKGIIEGDSLRQVRALLREKQLRPLSVSPSSQKQTTKK